MREQHYDSYPTDHADTVLGNRDRTIAALRAELRHTERAFDQQRERAERAESERDDVREELTECQRERDHWMAGWQEQHAEVERMREGRDELHEAWMCMKEAAANAESERDELPERIAQTLERHGRTTADAARIITVADACKDAARIIRAYRAASSEQGKRTPFQPGCGRFHADDWEHCDCASSVDPITATEHQEGDDA